MRTDKRMCVGRLIVLTTLLLLQVSAAARGQDRGEARTEYVVRAGDTLFGLARRFEVSVADLKRANGLESDQIQVGQRLAIPTPGESLAAPEQPTAEPESTAVVVDSVKTFAPVADTVLMAASDSTNTRRIETGFLTVRPGESIYDVALATGLAIDSLVALNPDLPAFFTDSTRLVVPVKYATVRYRVKRGDTLFKIAREAGTSVASIRAANDLTGDIIRVGQVLIVPSSGAVMRRAGDLPLPVIAEGELRVYPPRFAGRLMAGGRTYDPESYTVSHRDLPIGSIVLLSRPNGSRRTFAEVTDRLPRSAAYLMDVSEAVWNALASEDESNLEVEVRVVRYGPAAN